MTTTCTVTIEIVQPDDEVLVTRRIMAHDEPMSMDGIANTIAQAIQSVKDCIPGLRAELLAGIVSYFYGYDLDDYDGDGSPSTEPLYNAAAEYTDSMRKWRK